jgi:hypothetical protein
VGARLAREADSAVCQANCGTNFFFAGKRALTMGLSCWRIPGLKQNLWERTCPQKDLHIRHASVARPIAFADESSHIGFQALW